MKFDFKAELGELTPKIAQGAKIYIFGTGAYWDYICKYFKFTTLTNIEEAIDGFIDNDVNKQGKMHHGKPVNALEDIDPEDAIILISVFSSKALYEISSQLSKIGMYWKRDYFSGNVLYTMLVLQWGYKRLLQFKNKHEGERCFIIGNGSSLTTGDLDKLKNEVTFATNRIYLLFDKSVWRPTYYVVADAKMFREFQNEIATVDCTRFYALESVECLDDFTLSGDYFYSNICDHQWKSPLFWKPGFSEEAITMYAGATVTYACIQLAVYMGFSDIYLLGVDDVYANMVTKNGEIITSNTSDYFTPQYLMGLGLFQIDIANAAYAKAREYCDSHNIKICNATRGGNLEVFDRVDFDSLV